MKSRGEEATEKEANNDSANTKASALPESITGQKKGKGIKINVLKVGNERIKLVPSY